MFDIGECAFYTDEEIESFKDDECPTDWWMKELDNMEGDSESEDNNPYYGEETLE